MTVGVEVLKCLGYSNVAEILAAPDLQNKYDIWYEYDCKANAYNFGLSIYDEDMYILSEYACHAGIYTGNKEHFNKLKEFTSVKFCNFYKESVFIILGCIPEKLWVQSEVEQYLKAEPVW